MLIAYMIIIIASVKVIACMITIALGMVIVCVLMIGFYDDDLLGDEDCLFDDGN